MSEGRYLKNITLNSFPFFKREKRGGKLVSNQCGRDFLYYACSYLKLGMLNGLSAEQITQHNIFGLFLHPYLAWTQLQFFRVPGIMARHGLVLSINRHEISSWWQFVCRTLFSRLDFTSAITSVRTAIANNHAVGIDISIGLGGLLDHVLFVYGYDEKGLLVFETTQTLLQYHCIDKEKGIYHLPYTEIKKRWTRFGRVWCVELKN